MAETDKFLSLKFSPRSIEACKRQGIDPSELIVLHIDEVKKRFKDKETDKATWDQRAKFLEEQREEKLKTLLQVRYRLFLK